MTLGNWPRLGVLAFGLCACSVDDRALSVASGDGSPRDEVGAAGGSGGATERALQPDTDELGATSTARGVLTAKTAALDFGDQEVGLAGALQSWVVSNSGMTPTADLRVELSIAPHFEMIDNACRGPLAPGASCRLNFRYHPATTGDHAGSVVVGDGENQVSLTLIGHSRVRLTVLVVGRGTVTGPGIDCGTTCTTLVEADERVVLDATTTNGSGSFFTGFSGTTCVGAARACAIRLNATTRVTATFAEQTNNLIFVASGSLRSNLGSTAAYDAECNLRASAAGINDASGRGYIAAISSATSFWDRVPAGVRGWMRLDGLPFGDTTMMAERIGPIIQGGKGWIVLAAALVLAVVSYGRAVSAAEQWGRWVRAAFDLFRSALAEKVGLTGELRLGPSKDFWTLFGRAIMYGEPKRLDELERDFPSWKALGPTKAESSEPGAES